MNIGAPRLNPSYSPNMSRIIIGWVERSDTHQSSLSWSQQVRVGGQHGYWPGRLNPSYNRKSE
jgi:hypothetical protein